MSVYNREKLLALTGNDEAFMDELTGIFLEDVSLKITELKQAVSEKDTAAALFIAHSLKGVSGAMTAETVAQAALQMESAIRSGDFMSADACLEMIKTEFEKFKEALRG